MRVHVHAQRKEKGHIATMRLFVYIGVYRAGTIREFRVFVQEEEEAASAGFCRSSLLQSVCGAIFQAWMIKYGLRCASFLFDSN